MIETGDVFRVKRLVTVRRSPLVTAELRYTPPADCDFVVVLLGALPHDGDPAAFSKVQLAGLGVEVAP